MKSFPTVGLKSSNGNNSATITIRDGGECSLAHYHHFDGNQQVWDSSIEFHGSYDECVSEGSLLGLKVEK